VSEANPACRRPRRQSEASKPLASLSDQRSWRSALYVRRQKIFKSQPKPAHLAILTLQAAISKSRSRGYRPVKNCFLLRATPPVLHSLCSAIFGGLYCHRNGADGGQPCGTKLARWWGWRASGARSFSSTKQLRSTRSKHADKHSLLHKKSWGAILSRYCARSVRCSAQAAQAWVAKVPSPLHASTRRYALCLSPTLSEEEIQFKT
jgi:hypothetical protein